MPKLSVGYQYNQDMPFPSLCTRYADKIDEVYFAWVDQPSGRSMIGGFDGYFDYSLQEAMIRELTEIRNNNIKLNLLFNSNCYGDDAMSRTLEGRVSSIIDYLTDKGLRPESITTTSLAIAFIIKENYSDIKTRASVNMKISSIQGMKYVSHLFDGFCVAKECNRDTALLRELKSYTEENGKHITLLANSGCLYNCSGQIFHDNMVAHEAGISKQHNIEFMPYTCWEYLKNAKNRPTVLQNTWIRPEDIHNYETLCDNVKLATRMHRLPGLVIDAYARRSYSGNLLDLFEPGHGPLLAPFVIDNDRFPADWFERTSTCSHKCDRCTYCKDVYNQVCVNSEN